MDSVQKVLTAAGSRMGDLRVLIAKDKAPAAADSLFDKRSLCVDLREPLTWPAPPLPSRDTRPLDVCQ